MLSHIYDGFDENTVYLLRQEVMSVEKMPDDSISVEEMKQYGYKWGGMLPMREEAAAEVMKSCQIYRLYGDDIRVLKKKLADVLENRSERNRWISHFTQFSTMETLDRKAVVHMIQSMSVRSRMPSLPPLSIPMKEDARKSKYRPRSA